MSYFNESQLNSIGFKSIGRNVKISDKASIYDPHLIEIGDNSRVDDFCVLSGSLTLGRNVHITPQCLLAGGLGGLVIEDFATLAYGVKVFTQSDDYSGLTMTNSTLPSEYKNEAKLSNLIAKHSIIGAGSVIMPGVTIDEGTAVGAGSVVLSDTLPWSIYVGVPSKKIKERNRELLNFERILLSEA